RLRQTLSEQPGNDDWLTLGRWLLANPSARTISPFSRITVTEWIERRFQENMTNSFAELEQWAISTGDAVLLERVSQARPAAVSAVAARASARALEAQRNEASHRQDMASRSQARFLNALAWLSAASPREDLRDGRIAVVLAEKAVAATSRKDPLFLGTLAAGLAEAGRFAEAVLVQREALELLNDAKRKEDYSSRLKLYESKSPYRDAQAMDFPEILSIGKLYESRAPYRDAAANGLAPAAYDRLGMAVLWARGTFCAQFAQWTLVASDLTKAIALNPDENLNWFLLAPLLLETGDIDGYRKHCHAMLARFGTTNDPNIAQRTAKVCLLLPLDGADLAAASKLAETAVTLGKNDPPAAYCQFARGLAEYRQANFAQAVEWTQKALSQPGTDYNRDIQAYSVLSMALHRLNRAGEAHEALSKASELAGAKLPKLDSGDLGPNWHNWIIAQTLLREAKVLIDGAAKGDAKTR
ncbi:MAG: hypothetical protein NT154_03930, partial [Verrucomicrobia bacterium]|nr:hypothetical protein [Verrucomicrobiota bacterium]